MSFYRKMLEMFCMFPTKIVEFFMKNEKRQQLGEFMFLHMLPAAMIMSAIIWATWGEPICSVFVFLAVLLITASIRGIVKIFREEKK